MWKGGMVLKAAIERTNRLAFFYGALASFSVVLSIFPAIIDGSLKFVAIFILSVAVTILVVKNFHRWARVEITPSQVVFCNGEFLIARADIEKIASRQKAGDDQFQFVLNTRKRRIRWLPGVVFALGKVVMFRVEGEGADGFVNEFEKWAERPD